jgi:hypothetical protein
MYTNTAKELFLITETTNNKNTRTFENRPQTKQLRLSPILFILNIPKTGYCHIPKNHVILQL